jgi:hypothetical protein
LYDEEKPVWQNVQHSEPSDDMLYERVKKTPGLGNEKNLMLALLCPV